MFDLSRSDWGAQPGSFISIAWSARPGVETHHSVGLYGTTRAGSWMKAIERDHLARGWRGPFYNVGIYTDGTIVEGRPVTAQSGVIRDLTVCFAGDYRTRHLTDAQKQAWHRVRSHALAQGATLAKIAAELGVPDWRVIMWANPGALRNPLDPTVTHYQPGQSLT